MFKEGVDGIGHYQVYLLHMIQFATISTLDLSTNSWPTNNTQHSSSFLQAPYGFLFILENMIDSNTSRYETERIFDLRKIARSGPARLQDDPLPTARRLIKRGLFALRQGNTRIKKI